VFCFNEYSFSLICIVGEKLHWRGKPNWTRCQNLGVGSVLPTEGTSDAASRHRHKSKETLYSQRTILIKAKSLYKLKINSAWKAATIPIKEKRHQSGSDVEEAVSFVVSATRLHGRVGTPPTYGVENANTSWERLMPQTPLLPMLMEMSEPGTCTKFNVVGSKR